MSGSREAWREEKEARVFKTSGSQARCRLRSLHPHNRGVGTIAGGQGAGSDLSGHPASGMTS